MARSTKKNDNKSSTNKSDGAANAELDSLLRDFFNDDEQAKCTVVVDLGTSVSVASVGAQSVLREVETIAGAEAMPVFEARPATRATIATLSTGVPTQAPSIDTGRFVEFAVGGATEAADLATELRNKLGDQSVEAVPAPQATPAIGPATFEQARNGGQIHPPNFFEFQGYLADGPSGLGYMGAWSRPGGDGAGVTIIDVEGGWRTSHAELSETRFSLWSGRNQDTDAWKEHGTAVVSMLAATHDGHGTASICPGARTGMVSVFDQQDRRQRIANSVFAAGDLMNAGDVLLLELQRPGPRTGYAADPDQKGYLPLIFWPDIRAAIKSLVERGITVIAVGGNGGENLDDEIYGDRFHTKHDTGCIVVAAGNPPTGQFGPARARCDFSNYGNIMDVQAWGQSVVTAGYGDLWGQEQTDLRYTAKFMGTSSAAPLIAGVAACVQGRHKAVFGVPVNPVYLREVLRTVGWPAEGTEQGERGNFVLQPDLSHIFAALDIS